jgi:2-oxoisovalerate dehydrogenase E2 component (dihydrolipoyl transacylase)
LVHIDVAEGQTVAIGQSIAQIEIAEVEDFSSVAAPADDPSQLIARASATEAVLVTPAVRGLAEERGVDVSAITGTGGGGRITRGDVLGHAEAARHSAHKHAAEPAPKDRVGPGEELIRVSAVRRQIAENLVRSVTNIPHAWGLREVDMTALVRYREEQKVQFHQKYGIALSYLPFVIQVVCDALKANPLLNSTWRDDGILVKHFINLGIAIALPDAVIVPVIKGADQMGLVDLARAVNDLTVRARDKKLTHADVADGTFTLNNVGAIGSFASMSIINYPQAAILTTQTIVRRPVGRNDEIVLRDMMNLTLSFDHRIVDGIQSSKFLSAVQSSLESWRPEMIRH